MSIKEAAEGARDQAVKSAPRELLEELFQDYYSHRYRLYIMNFLRGLFFGFGSVVGATIIVALLLWVLSLFNELPFVGDLVRNVQHSIESAHR
jgi:hypothetical protein